MANLYRVTALPAAALGDYFSDRGSRPEGVAYFECIDGYNDEVRSFLTEYCRAASAGGAVLDGGPPNPDNGQLEYYTQMLGGGFRLSEDFLHSQLGRWLPRVEEDRRRTLSIAILETLSALRAEGKNDNALRNVYVKFMCWLYYRFEPLLHPQSGGAVPKILCGGAVSRHGLLMLEILSICGVDIVLLADGGAPGPDPALRRLHRLAVPAARPFPADFGIKTLQKDALAAQEQERLLGPAPRFGRATNTWLSGDYLRDLRKQPRLRGGDPGLYYNAFIRIRGVEDTTGYENDLYNLQLDLKKDGRRLCVVSGALPTPGVEEIGQIKRGNYQTAEQLAAGLAPSLRLRGRPDLEQILRRAFTELILAEGKKEGMKLGRLTAAAVYLLCWLNRYADSLFSGWQMPDVGCFLYLGGCQNENEALFCRLLAAAPVDVVVLVPDLNRGCCLSDALLYEKQYDHSLRLDRFPEDRAGLRLGTTAYHAEQDLNSLLFDGTGLYRDRQFSKASVITLRTMYEELSGLWDLELRYRPNFSTQGDQVNIPVVFAKVSGVKHRDVLGYWRSVRAFMTPEAEVCSRFPRIASLQGNPFLSVAPLFLQNGRLQRDKIRNHPSYRYGLFKATVQDYIFDKIQLLLDQDLIRTGYERQNNEIILSVLLNLEKETLQLIQNFDFTKKNPKLVYIVTGEAVPSAADAIVLAFLNQIGFDIILFVPTGYQCAEQHYTRPILDEHQIGDYMYDLPVPDFERIPASAIQTLKKVLFRREN